MFADRKFTDRDIRDNPSLIYIAEEYLRGYTGDFEYLVACQEFLSDNGRIPASLARPVLNCMRNDPYALQKLSQIHKQPIAAQEEYVRPAQMYLKSKLKHKYALSQAKNASVAHMIRHDGRPVVLYYPYVQKFQVITRLWCGKTLARKAKHTDDNEGRKVCSACQTNEAIFG